MPTQPIQCPSCGSGNTRYRASESYVCEHCDTEFRWIDPTKQTVVHEPTVCSCGAIATALCVRCRKPCCKEHADDTWSEYFNIWLLDVFSNRSIPEWADRLFEEHRIPTMIDAKLCEDCGEECMRIANIIEVRSGGDEAIIRNLEAELARLEETPVVATVVDDDGHSPQAGLLSLIVIGVALPLVWLYCQFRKMREARAEGDWQLFVVVPPVVMLTLGLFVSIATKSVGVPLIGLAILYLGFSLYVSYSERTAQSAEEQLVALRTRRQELRSKAGRTTSNP